MGDKKMLKSILAMAAGLVFGLTAGAADNNLFALGTGRAAALPSEYKVMIIVSTNGPDLVQGAKRLESRVEAIVAAIKKLSNGQTRPECGLPMVMNDQNRTPDILTLPDRTLLSTVTMTNGESAYLQDIYVIVSSLPALNQLREAVFANDGVMVVRPALSAAQERELGDTALERAVKDAMGKARVMATAAGIGQIDFCGIEELPDNTPTAVPAGKIVVMNQVIEITKTVRVFYQFDPVSRKK